MPISPFKKVLIVPIIASIPLCLPAWRADADSYVQTNLVSDIAGLATIQDANLVNPWGVSHNATSPFWTSNQGTQTATLYNVTGSTNVTKVNINPPSGFVAIPPMGSAGPTGQVANVNTSSFPVGVATGGDGGSARFIFSNLNGTISAWDTGPTAFVQATTPGAVYTGLAINQTQTQLYAANTASGRIDVFGSNFAPIVLGANAFATPMAISNAGLVHFNVQSINGEVYVTYAPAGPTAQRNAPLGMGAVAVFNESGALLRTLDPANAHLAAPWGITLAPASFGQFAGDLLVGNFSFAHSSINAFDPLTLAFIGSILIDAGGHAPGGLWFLGFGQGGNNGSPGTLYFSDGIDGETHGLFGAIEPVPIPPTWPLFATGLAGLGLLNWHRKRKAAAGV